MNIINKDSIPKRISKINYKDTQTKPVRKRSISSVHSIAPKNLKAKNNHNSLVLKRFILYSSQTSETILARDILARIKATLNPKSNDSDSVKLLSNVLQDQPEKIRKILSGYLESDKLTSVDDLITHFNIKLKKLYIIMQNIDSLQDNITQNPILILEKIENQLKQGNTGRFTINSDSAVKLLNT